MKKYAILAAVLFIGDIICFMLLISAPTLLALAADIMLITGTALFFIYDAGNKRRKKENDK